MPTGSWAWVWKRNTLRWNTTDKRDLAKIPEVVWWNIYQKAFNILDPKHIPSCRPSRSMNPTFCLKSFSMVETIIFSRENPKFSMLKPPVFSWDPSQTLRSTAIVQSTSAPTLRSDFLWANLSAKNLYNHIRGTKPTIFSDFWLLWSVDETMVLVGFELRTKDFRWFWSMDRARYEPTLKRNQSQNGIKNTRLLKLFRICVPLLLKLIRAK